MSDHWIDTLSPRVTDFHRDHPIVDMLGENLTHPRHLVDDIDLGVRDDSTCRGDFIKWRDWGLSVVVCKGGPKEYDENFAALWQQQPERRAGRSADRREPLFLTLAVKNATQLTAAVLDRFLEHVEAHPDKVLLIQRRSDLAEARASGRIGLLMASNRSDWFGDSLGTLRMFARLGLRLITLSQAMRDLGYDAYNETRSAGRLTDVGVRIIQEMNRNGIVIDVSHTNDVCTRDIIETSAQPIVASHSNPRELEPSPRNMPREIMQALASRGGVLGIMPPIVRPAGEQPFTRIAQDQMATTLRYIRHAVEVMGIDHVGIGTHFNSAVLPWLTDALLRDGFSDSDVAQIMGGNFLRLLGQVLPE